MIVGLVVSTVTLIYVTVKLDTFSDLLSNSELSLNRIQLNNSDTQWSIDDISDKLQSYYENNSSVKYIYGLIENPKCVVTCVITDEKEILDTYMKGNTPIKGRFFSENEIANGENVMVAVGVGTKLESIDFNGNKIKVVGSMIPNGITNGYIPLNTVRKNNIIPNKYIVMYDSELTISEIKKYIADLENIFPEAKVETMMDYYSENGKLLLDFENVYLIIMAIVSVLSCAYLYSYIIQIRIRQIYIFKLCGATISKLVRLFLLEIIFIIIFQYIISLIIFRVCLIPALNKFDIAFIYGYSFRHILIAFAIIALAALLVFIPMLVFYCKKNAIEIKQYQKG